MSGNCHAPTGNLFAPRRFGQAYFPRDATRLALAITGGSIMWKTHRAMESITMDRESKTDSLFVMKISTFDDEGGAYNQADAGGFIKLNALRIAGNLAKLRRK